MDPPRPGTLGSDGDFFGPFGGGPEICGFPDRDRCGEAVCGFVLYVRAEPNDVYDMGVVAATQEVSWDGT